MLIQQAAIIVADDIQGMVRDTPQLRQILLGCSTATYAPNISDDRRPRVDGAD